MSYRKATVNAVIHVKEKLSEKYMITNVGPVHQSLRIEIHRNGTRVSIGQKTDIITILRRFGMEHTDGVSMPEIPF
jgi:hypothetical protein